MSVYLLRNISELATPVRPGPAFGAEAMRCVNVIRDAAMLVEDGVIRWVGMEDRLGDVPPDALEVDLERSAVVPGLVDPHTHAIWAGDRLADFERRTNGVAYEAILASGGGIWHTIRETAPVPTYELARMALPRIESLIASGATTIEIKSGYGYNPASELRSLEAIRLLARRTRAHLVATLLIHVCPEGAEAAAAYRTTICRDLIPEVARLQLASAVDVFVEHHAWGATDAAMILDSARLHGLGLKLHTEQFRSVGGIEIGLSRRTLSLDHLEVATAEQCKLIGRSKTVATILPGVSFHLGIAAAPGRALIDAGAAVAVGTDLNPGSSPLFSASAALAMAVRLNGLTPKEALTAGTVNAAAALGLEGPGCLAEGRAADFVVLDTPNWMDLLYVLGGNPVREVWIGGERAARRDA